MHRIITPCACSIGTSQASWFVAEYPCMRAVEGANIAITALNRMSSPCEAQESSKLLLVSPCGSWQALGISKSPNLKVHRSPCHPFNKRGKNVLTKWSFWKLSLLDTQPRRKSEPDCPFSEEKHISRNYGLGRSGLAKVLWGSYKILTADLQGRSLVSRQTTSMSSNPVVL